MREETSGSPAAALLPRGGWLRLAPPAILILLSLALLSPLLAFPFARDHGVYAVIAQAMERGLLPYRDAWDIKTPGIFFLFRAAFALFGENMWGIRLLEWAAQAATAAALCLLGRRLTGSPAAAWLGGCFYILFQLHYLNYWHTAQAESFLNLPLVLTLLLGLRALETADRRRAAALAAGAGLFLGAVVVLKYPAAIIAACLVPAALTRRGLQPRGGEKGPARILLLAGCLLTGAAVFPLAVALRFAAGGALGDLVETLFVFAPRYAGITFSGVLLTHGLKVLFGFFASGGLQPLKLLCLAGLAVSLARRDLPGRLLLPCWFGLAYVAIWIQAKFFLYHYLPFYAPCALLAGLAAARLAAFLANRLRATPAARQRAERLALAALLALPFLLDGRTIAGRLGEALAVARGTLERDAYFQQFRDGEDFSLPADLEVAEYLKSRTEPDDTLFIWGFEPLVYFLAERRPASRFITHQPLASRWQMPGWREELLAELQMHRPRYILVLRRDRMPAVTGWDRDSAELLQGFPELARLIDEQFRLETEIEDFLVYRRPEETGGSH